ncbi:MAG: pyruvate kinase [Alphaproteobacteria bacterium]|nr:pyruvate kinase [Alphaproteobacteria bacterium]
MSKHLASINRRCRIIATVGPKSNILRLLQAGASAFRLNFSHGTHEEHLQRIQAIRAAEEKSGRFVPIIADLQGPKIRVGTFDDDFITLRIGQEVTLEVSDKAGRDGLIRLPHPEILEAIQPGDELKLDDGLIVLTVTAKENNSRATAKVEVPGKLSSRKGVNIPSRQLPISAMTDKDRRDLEFALAHGVDIVALSFVQSPDDVAEAQRLIKGKALVMAKIEKPLALQSIDAIAALSDMVMVARGDLGVELPIEQVPGAQRRIVHACRRAGKPVIIATQMLQSMVDTPIPTRAEASDVATAVYMGVDAVMLSAESAVGRHPETAVAMMDRIIRAVESDSVYWEELYSNRKQPIATVVHALCTSARDIARLMDAEAIFAFTRGGGTAFGISRERSSRAIYGITPELSTARKLALVWGITPVLSPDETDSDRMLEWASRFAKEQLGMIAGQHVVVLAGTPFGVPGTTNTLKILTL